MDDDGNNNNNTDRLIDHTCRRDQHNNFNLNKASRIYHYACLCSYYYYYNYYYYYYYYYSSFMHNIAHPLRIQWSWLATVGMGSATTKLVEWPVVDRVPARMDVLYSGQS